MQLSTFPLTSVVATTLLAAVFAAAAAVPPSTTSTYANFSQSCTAVGLSHSFFLGATCCYPELVGTGEGEDHGGGVVEAQSLNELDLTMCIGLDQGSGRMKWEV